jgi:subtilisin family serine protease
MSHSPQARNSSLTHSSIMRGLAVLGPMVLVLLFVAGARLWPAAAQPLKPSLSGKVGQDVLPALRAQGQAHVMVALRPPRSSATALADLSALRRDVASLQEGVLSQVDASGYRSRHRYRAVPALAGTLLSEAALYALAGHPDVVRIDLDVGGTGSLAYSVPLIGADLWHASGITGAGVVVAVLDSGLDTDHDDLAGDLIHQECFLDDDGLIDGSGLCPNGSDRQSGPDSAEDDAGHGTHVTGIITSKGTHSSVGVAPDAQIVAIKVTAGPSFSGVFYYFSEIVAALDYIINSRPDVKVINMSLVTNALFAGDCDNSTSWTMAGAIAIDTLRANGVVAFASSGNDGSGTEMAAPACLSNVISVGATDDADNVASFTDSNASTDVMAPGVGIVSTAIGNGTTAASGTSMAAPHAAGCAALFIQTGATVTPDAIEARLESSPVQVTDVTNGLTFPRIDCSPDPPAAVNLTGPALGEVGVTYAFTASVSPITVTRPLTYVWTATGHSPLTRSGGLSDTVRFAWNSPGSRTVTVTVGNAVGAVTDTHTIALSATPPAGVAISGPTQGSAGYPHSFVASTTPVSATRPLTYVWEATGQSPITDTGGLSATVLFDWAVEGTKRITATVRNVAGTVSDTHAISITVTPPTSVTIAGRRQGSAGIAYAFTASVSPLTATQPLTYAWLATEQAPITHTAGLSDIVVFGWTTRGRQVITVTAGNEGGRITATHAINVYMDRKIYLPVLLK